MLGNSARRMPLPPPRLAPAAHARPAEGGARAAVGHRLGAWSHFVEAGLARALRSVRAVDLPLMMQGDPHLVEVRLVRAVSSRSSPHPAPTLPRKSGGGIFRGRVVDHRQLGGTQALE